MKNFNNIEDFELANNTQNDSPKALYKQFVEFKKSLKAIPLKVLKENGWLNSKDEIEAIGELFSNLLSTKNTLFRKNASSNDALISLWHAKVMIKAKKMIMEKNFSFEGLDKGDLIKIAKLSSKVENIKLLPKMLASKGILLIYERSLPGLKLDGLVYLLLNKIPCIAISFRHARIDHFWFTFMHELAHLVLHFDKLNYAIIDDLEDEEHSSTDDEISANRLAKDSLVPKIKWRNCKARTNFSLNNVYSFAQEIGIHPAIVAGLLRKERNKYDFFSKLIYSVDTRKLVFENE